MGTLGFQVLIESGRQLITQVHDLWFTIIVTLNLMSDLVAYAMTQSGAREIRAQARDLDGQQHVLCCGREVIPHALLPNVQERDREGVRSGPFLRRDHKLDRPGLGAARRPVQMVDGPSWRHTGKQSCSTVI